MGRVRIRRGQPLHATDPLEIRAAASLLGDECADRRARAARGRSWWPGRFHCRSSRARGPLIPVDCVAIPSELAESTLFGHVRGAFTGAAPTAKVGSSSRMEARCSWTKWATCHRLSRRNCCACWRTARSCQWGPVTPGESTFGVVAATNADLHERMADGSFREDLYFESRAISVVSPRCASGAGDVGVLADHFLDLFAAEIGVPRSALTPAALQLLKGARFPATCASSRT